MHSNTTSFDFLLPMIFSGYSVKKEDFIKMGLGGMLYTNMP